MEPASVVEDEAGWNVTVTQSLPARPSVESARERIDSPPFLTPRRKTLEREHRHTFTDLIKSFLSTSTSGQRDRSVGLRNRRTGRAALPVREVAPDVWSIGPWGRTATVVHLVRSTPGWTLVDAGWVGDGGRLADAVSRVVGSAKPVGILLTHAHPDHEGDSLELARRWECPVWLSAINLLLGRTGISRPPWYTTWDRRLATESIAKLAALAPAIVAGGHGRPLTGTDTAARVSAFSASQ